MDSHRSPIHSPSPHSPTGLNTRLPATVTCVLLPRRPNHASLLRPAHWWHFSVGCSHPSSRLPNRTDRFSPLVQLEDLCIPHRSTNWVLQFVNNSAPPPFLLSSSFFLHRRMHEGGGGRALYGAGVQKDSQRPFRASAASSPTETRTFAAVTPDSPIPV
ncbi:unnamed protein product [Schistocephalus solidus]|uniref:Uncharacterized protein n=1 Tax=Schistocephalus solidus TaxID=70667 RepID=A0A183SVU3_SCHSO|nr:unnamed protein product [Schistocephalus solidus]